jgi:hypothetical protein
MAQTTQTTGLVAAMGVDRYTAWVGEESFLEHPRRAPVAERPTVGVRRALTRGSSRPTDG